MADQGRRSELGLSQLRSKWHTSLTIHLPAIVTKRIRQTWSESATRPRNPSTQPQQHTHLMTASQRPFPKTTPIINFPIAHKNPHLSRPWPQSRLSQFRPQPLNQRSSPLRHPTTFNLQLPHLVVLLLIGLPCRTTTTTTRLAKSMRRIIHRADNTTSPQEKSKN